MATNIVQEISNELDSLNRSERKVAEVILADPQAATRSSIAVLARAAQVSEPTVNRFCKRFNTAGFPDFKLHLAQALASGVPYVNRNVEPDDDAESYTNKIIDATIAALVQAKKNIDPQTINLAVDQLIQAKQIMFYGLGASGPVATDAQHKFFRFNIPVTAYDDILMQRMSAAASSTGDVIVVISYTGRTKDLVDVAEIGRQSGATVIGITAPNSPLADHCSIVVDVDAPEDTDVYMPMTSRIMHLTVIDILATGVTLRRGPDFLKHLKAIKDSLKDTRYPAK
ncbi:MurR/RpiR family transcriptional regulator [Marinobacterium sp. LSUCC0821]|jgi:RpiR family carbohydrate utilization transcriptional regulator|uniref:MurR/RpiR family transcriptional regulator n=1 Tax=Marinobacterium sp. LSUCC0821 TaxID=2668067 RepID=UPI001451C18D|nr:MurR/RpiR family transcriptional regulator [Marinobacterium sp. LSUCC0821]QJD71080.1 MurR/RpiR family transcriptional regulator [Marinobacterium sp. LSUCC0821]